MPMRDSVDKIVTSYFAAVNSKPFTYKGKHYPVKTLTVSPLLLRGFDCPPGCGGCCPTFSLDYLPAEEHPYHMRPRQVLFNGKAITVCSDTQEDRGAHHCRNLNHDNGRCGIHGKQPFSCDFELIRFLHTGDDMNARMLTRLFGRGHAMLRVDGERGALCSITPITDESVADTVRKLRRLAQWCEHFGVEHRVHDIIKWAQSGFCYLPLVISPNSLNVTNQHHFFTL